ncbi:MAG: Holliday junction resolvase RuvX [Flavobacteriales bacterium]
MARLIGIDYGTVRTGIAWTDDAQIIASPLETVPTAEIINKLTSLVSNHTIEGIVVGEAKRLNQEASEITHQQNKFVQELQKKFPQIPIHRMNEMFTSKMASQSMLTSGMKKSQRREKGHLDQMSAALILQSFLDFGRR